MRLTYLLLSPTFGMHQYTADLANRMAGTFDVQLVTGQRYPQDRYGPAVTVLTPADLPNTGLSPSSLRVRQLKQVQRALVESRPDVVHITGPHLWNVWLVRWLRRMRIPVIHTIHDLDPHHGASYGRLLHLWNWAILRTADHIVVHGEKYREHLVAGGLEPGKVTCTWLTHLFVGYETRRELDGHEFDVRYEPMVLFFGRQEPYKGVDSLLKAFDRLDGLIPEKETGQRPRLVLAGPGNEVQKMQRDSGPEVEWRNHLIGDQEGIELFRRCAVVVLPYRDATQSAIVAAAYYFRKPAIVTAVGALAEYVEPGKTGLVVEGDAVVEGLGLAMLDVLMRPGYKESLGRAGRAWYDEQRSRETQRFVDVYQRLIN